MMLRISLHRFLAAQEVVHYPALMEMLHVVCYSLASWEETRQYLKTRSLSKGAVTEPDGS